MVVPVPVDLVSGLGWPVVGCWVQCSAAVATAAATETMDTVAAAITAVAWEWMGTVVEWVSVGVAVAVLAGWAVGWAAV